VARPKEVLRAERSEPRQMAVAIESAEGKTEAASVSAAATAVVVGGVVAAAAAAAVVVVVAAG
jgi:hypothetical protein